MSSRIAYLIPSRKSFDLSINEKDTVVFLSKKVFKRNQDLKLSILEEKQGLSLFKNPSNKVIGKKSFGNKKKFLRLLKSCEFIGLQFVKSH